MLKVIAAGLVLTTLLVAGCSSDPETSKPDTSACDNAKSKCPNDPPPPVAECKDALSHPTCGNAALAFFVCGAEHQTCTSDGTTDQSAIERACAMQLTAAQKCFGMNDAGGGGG